MNELLNQFVDLNRQIVNETLQELIMKQSIPERLKQAILYSINAGGKRVRPILMIASCEAFQGDKHKVLPIAAALEMVHTYSLIHDDLPAMDNDDLRRGLPTNHIKFDESTAILAGDALLTLSFQVINEAETLTPEEKVFASKKLSLAAGGSGMVAGQVLDIAAENKRIELQALENIHRLKTGQLLIYAMEMGAYMAGTSYKELEAIKACADQMGLIFQIQDDILDVNGDQQKMGKNIGSDLEKEKSTYPKIYGLDGALKEKQEKVDSAKQILVDLGIENSMLAELIDYLSDRDQ
ncbi:polyprenyl synthetase family protein [Amphibacillus cookii]|uniref:polyprenyl synthetase family protein n=1 Tax=Amphibacillus cookii TaxID=767787 RepID=UPI00195A0D67|nr:farnesyl diphosphate synthase [Amphibacillus cookii]MBM7542442.1 geranylgeranyl diphosphate synthase type II [Amphibacillus cookii]